MSFPSARGLRHGGQWARLADLVERYISTMYLLASLGSHLALQTNPVCCPLSTFPKPALCKFHRNRLQ